ncbi:MAG: 30S ribosomal protein S17 [Chloroflexi bacterium]|nr:30S ribosomal protein S17 [Chloroflexota bacterium]
MKQREYVGRVTSDRMQKTVVVSVEWVQHHPLYKKAIRRTTTLYVHDPKGECHVGDLVRVVEVRPLSKTKRFLVREVVRRKEVVEMEPSEVDRELLGEVKAGPAQARGEAKAEPAGVGAAGVSAEGAQPPVSAEAAAPPSPPTARATPHEEAPA